MYYVTYIKEDNARVKSFWGRGISAGTSPFGVPGLYALRALYSITHDDMASFRPL